MATRDQLYAKFGITAEAAQLFETVLGTIVLIAKGRNNDWFVDTDPVAAATILKRVERSTLGGILNGLLSKEHQLSSEDLVMFKKRAGYPK